MSTLIISLPSFSPHGFHPSESVALSFRPPLAFPSFQKFNRQQVRSPEVLTTFACLLRANKNTKVRKRQGGPMTRSEPGIEMKPLLCDTVLQINELQDLSRNSHSKKCHQVHSSLYVSIDCLTCLYQIWFFQSILGRVSNNHYFQCVLEFMVLIKQCQLSFHQVKDVARKQSSCILNKRNK